MAIVTLPNDDYFRLSRIGATGSDAPITLKDACSDVFNDAISVATLMAKHRRKKLVIYKIGRQYFTSLNELNARLTKCQTKPLTRDKLNRQVDGKQVQRHTALAALLALIARLKR